jgi:putative N6-adenine-specific DNA methylase
MENDPLIRFFVSCAPGIEKILEKETETLGLKPSPGDLHTVKPFPGEESGGLLFEGTYQDVIVSNLQLRTANRVIVRVGEFYAAAFSELRKKASRLEWEKYLIPGQVVNVRAVCHKSRLYHSDGVAERVLGAINDHFSHQKYNQKPCPQGSEGLLVLVRLVNDLCTISIDSSGEPLHKRGYRQAVAKAPLRENLAASLLLFSGWKGQCPLIDPFCGSGTIPVEAALLSRRIPPGITREFAFTKWPIFHKEELAEIINQSQKEIIALSAPIYGYDRDKGAIESASANASRAGQKNEITFVQQAISSLEPCEAPGWVITNPPYGVRVSGNKDLRDLYARFGEILKHKFSNWKVGILCSDPKLTGNLKLGNPEKTIKFSNGGIPVEYSIFEIN